ncbi:MAG: AsmA family protein [Deltaproteobacteria bacterium]|nr:AsmA family protein [Deltaproteobacteria bacterium]
MRRAAKIIFFTLAGLLAVTAVTAGLYLASLKDEDYRRGIAALVNRFTDYQLAIDRPFTVNFAGRPTLRADRVRLILPDKEKSQLVFRQVLLKLRLRPLLHGCLDLEVAARCTDRQSLHFLLPKELLAVTDLKLAGRLETDGHRLTLEGLQVQGRNDQGLQIDASGRGRIEDFSASQPFHTLDLRIEVNSPDSYSLRGYLLDGLPELGPVRGRLRLTALSSTDLAADNIDLTFGSGDDFHLRVQGKIAKIPVDPDIINTGLEFKLAARLATTAELARLLGRPLPELGPLTASTVFSGSKKESRLEQLTVSVGRPEALHGEITGAVQLGDVNAEPASILRHLELAAFFTAPGGSRVPLSTTEAGRHWQVPAAETMTLGFTLAGNPGDLRLENLTLQGGRTTITGSLTSAWQTDAVHFAGTLATGVLYLDDFLPAAAEQSAPTGKDSSSSGSQAGGQTTAPLFSREPLPLTGLPELDGRLEIRADKIVVRGEELQDLRVTIKTAARKLDIDQASFVYQDGFFRARLTLDASGEIPLFNLECTTDDLDLETINRNYQLDLPVAGKITAASKLHSRGRSPHELAANLQGHFQMALEDGLVKRDLLSLVAIDLLGWSFDQAMLKKKYGVINCSILDLEAVDGVLFCRAFIVESPNLVITGKGSIDLGAETCKLVIYPKKKRKFWATVTPVTIKGPLRQPAVRAIPAKKAAIITGGLVLVPQFFLPAVGVNYLWEMLSKDKDKSRCLEYLHAEQAKRRALLGKTGQPDGPAAGAPSPQPQQGSQP